MEDEYELIPLSPIRRLEKRLEGIEKNATSGEMLGELMNIIKTNQQVVDHMAKTNTAMINRITDLSNSVEKMMAKIDEFVSRIETSEIKEESKEEDKFNERLVKLEKRLNSALLTTMARQRTAPGQSARPMPAPAI